MSSLVILQSTSTLRPPPRAVLPGGRSARRPITQANANLRVLGTNYYDKRGHRVVPSAPSAMPVATAASAPLRRRVNVVTRAAAGADGVDEAAVPAAPGRR